MNLSKVKVTHLDGSFSQIQLIRQLAPPRPGDVTFSVEFVFKTLDLLASESSSVATDVVRVVVVQVGIVGRLLLIVAAR